MLDEMRTFVVLAESGSLQRASERLFLTPSAVTRQIQRLEAALQTPLLDRRVKPGRITREGRAVLDGGRHMLRIMDDLKASGAKDAEPSGIFRVGLSHALAQPSLVASIQRLTSRFPRLQPVLSTHLRQQLIEQVRSGELDVALAFLSADDTMPGDLASSVLAAERRKITLSTDAGCSTRLGVLFEPHSRRGCANSALRSKSPPRSTISTCNCLSWRAGSAGGLSPRDFLPRIRSAGGSSESRGPASALRLRSCSCKPAIWAGSKPRRHFSNKSFETISPSARVVDRDEPNWLPAEDH